MQHQPLHAVKAHTRQLGLSPRTVRDLVGDWLAAGWLVLTDPARKSRRYHLSAEYRQFLGEIMAE